MALMRAPQRRFRITVRLSVEELRTLHGAAKRSGITLSAYARAVLLKAKPSRAAHRPPVEIVVLVQILARLGAIAGNLHEVVATVTREACKALLMPSTERALVRTLAELRSCRVLLMKALGRKAAPA